MAYAPTDFVARTIAIDGLRAGATGGIRLIISARQACQEVLVPLRCLLALLFCCGAAWWSVAADQTPSDVKVVVRDTHYDERGSIPPMISETTHYAKGPRIRQEWRPSAGYARDPKALRDYRYGPVIATIQQCDTGTRLEMNTRDREYEISPLPKGLTKDELKALAAKHPRPPEGAVKPIPTVTVERSTVDTGERKEFFGYTARHMIRTVHHVPHEGSHSLPSEVIEDGWYIDLDVRMNCAEPRNDGRRTGFAVLVAGSGGLDSSARDVYEFKTTGPEETGFPVKVTRSYRSTIRMPDGNTREFTSKSETEVVELSTAPLDRSLFEEPKGFKKVSHIDRQPPVPAWARVYMWWERLKMSVARVFQ
jgi:hypothetical protein